MHTVFTIGHSTRPAEELIALLQVNGVRTLIDVRRFPGSRRHPQYNREALARTLAEAGIVYRHEEELGGRREAARPDSPNGGWRNASFRAYADHLGTPAFASALARLRAEAVRGPVAIMCAEAVPWRCHRQLISDALVAGGAEVRHIVSRSEPAPHALNAMAVVDEEGGVTYPAEAPEQPDLFGGPAPAGDG